MAGPTMSKTNWISPPDGEQTGLDVHENTIAVAIATFWASFCNPSVKRGKNQYRSP